MIPAPLPFNETERLIALHEAAILDTPPERGFDELVQLAALICDAPIALVSLVDENRQWFKARVGLEVTETPRDLAFCAHAILQPDSLLVIENACQDPRFHDNPLVTGPPHIRFYAGAPLLTEQGHALGTLCVIDQQSRQMDQRQRQALQVLSRQVMQRIDLQLHMQARQLQGQLLERERERLQTVETQLRSVLANLPGTVYRSAQEPGRILFISDDIVTLTGYPVGDFTEGKGRNLSELIHPKDAERIRAQRQSELHAQGEFHLEYRLLHASGEERWVQERGRGVYGEDGQLQYLDGFIWDVSAQKQAARSLRAHEQKLTSLYQMAPVGLMLNRFVDGAFLEGNPELFRMTGYTEAEFAALKPEALTPAQFAPMEAGQRALLKFLGRYGPYEKQMLHKDGHAIEVLLQGALVRSPQGEAQIWSIVQDISERKRIEQMKSEFVSVVSHELRTPLTSIGGALGLVLGGALGEVSEQQQAVLNIAYQNSQRLSQLVNELLDIDKLAAGKMILDLQVQPLEPLLAQALDDNRAYAEQYGATLVLTERVPAVLIKVDSRRFQQIMSNLLSNAAKFSPSGAEVEISVSLFGDSPQEPQVRIAVTDHGPGIPEEFKQRIFQKFAQADASDARHKNGTGLGLAITRDLTEHMGGQVGFESRPGSTCFYVVFPVVAEESPL